MGISSVCGVRVALWGVEAGTYPGLLHQMESELFGGNTGHAAVSLTIPVTPENTELIRKYCAAPYIPVEKMRVHVPKAYQDEQGEWHHSDEQAHDEEVYVVTWSWFPGTGGHTLSPSINQEGLSERGGVHHDWDPRFKDALAVEERVHRGKLGKKQMAYAPLSVSHLRQFDINQRDLEAQILEVSAKARLNQSLAESLGVLRSKIVEKTKKISKKFQKKSRFEYQEKLLESIRVLVNNNNDLSHVLPGDVGVLQEIMPNYDALKSELPRNKKAFLKAIKVTLGKARENLKKTEQAITQLRHPSETEALLLNRFFPDWQETFLDSDEYIDMNELIRMISYKCDHLHRQSVENREEFQFLNALTALSDDQRNRALHKRNFDKKINNFTTLYNSVNSIIYDLNGLIAYQRQEKFNIPSPLKQKIFDFTGHEIKDSLDRSDIEKIQQELFLYTALKKAKLEIYNTLSKIHDLDAPIDLNASEHEILASALGLVNQHSDPTPSWLNTINELEEEPLTGHVLKQTLASMSNDPVFDKKYPALTEKEKTTLSSIDEDIEALINIPVELPQTNLTENQERLEKIDGLNDVYKKMVRLRENLQSDPNYEPLKEKWTKICDYLKAVHDFDDLQFLNDALPGHAFHSAEDIEITPDTLDKVFSHLTGVLRSEHQALIESMPTKTSFTAQDFESFMTLGLPPEVEYNLPLDTKSNPNAGVEHGMNVEGCLRAMQAMLTANNKYDLYGKNCSATTSKILSGGATTDHLRNIFEKNVLGALSTPQQVGNACYQYLQDYRESPNNSVLKRLKNFKPITNRFGKHFANLINDHASEDDKRKARGAIVPLAFLGAMVLTVRAVFFPKTTFQEIRAYRKFAKRAPNRGVKALMYIASGIAAVLALPLAVVSAIVTLPLNTFRKIRRSLKQREKGTLEQTHPDVAHQEVNQRIQAQSDLKESLGKQKTLENLVRIKNKKPEQALLNFSKAIAQGKIPHFDSKTRQRVEQYLDERNDPALNQRYTQMLEKAMKRVQEAQNKHKKAAQPTGFECYAQVSRAIQSGQIQDVPQAIQEAFLALHEKFETVEQDIKTHLEGIEGNKAALDKLDQVMHTTKAQLGDMMAAYLEDKNEALWQNRLETFKAQLPNQFWAISSFHVGGTKIEVESLAQERADKEARTRTADKPTLDFSFHQKRRAQAAPDDPEDGSKRKPKPRR